MFLPLDILLTRVVESGDLVLTDARGAVHRYGDGSGPRISVQVHDRATERALALDPESAGGGAYMQGRLTLAEGTIYDLFALIMRNVAAHPFPAWSQTLMRARAIARRMVERNPALLARRHVAHHYDIDPRIYALFLDSDRQYSCAYFTPGVDLERAQLAKKRHIAAKLALEPGQRVLDIGCGWGGLALYLAQATGARVSGITLSQEQLKVARRRALISGLAGKVDFALQDYRAAAGPFDRIVSVGMFEHVGTPHYGEYFHALCRLLTHDGVALLHTIGRSDSPAPTNPFISRYVFPGGALPSLSEIMAALEPTGLVVTDVEVLRLHYAETLRAWRQRFMARRAQAVAIAGEAFARMWEAYLAGSEASFRYAGLVVFQIQLAKRVDALPWTRDYLLAAEARLAQADAHLPLAGE